MVSPWLAGAIPAISIGGLAVIATAQGPAPEWAAFQKLSKARQVEVAAIVRSSLPDHPWVASLAALAADDTKPPAERAKALAQRRAKRVVEFPHEIVLPLRGEYVFGLGAVEPRDPAQPWRAPADAKQPPGKAAAAAAELEGVHHALFGCVPDADRALAAAMRRLDSDTSADAFAAFMHSWRNDHESFYEALDRTAGTKESVFFFDVMLGDFRSQFGRRHADELNGLDRAHDALHDAFLAYRQYRGFREAVAWTLVLPPDQPLPARLSRYEAKAKNTYSLREQVLMVAAVTDHDLVALLATITANATPLPSPLWRGYDPYPAWQQTFQASLGAMIERAGSTDAFLERVLDERRSLAEQLTRLAKGWIAAGSGEEPRVGGK